MNIAETISRATFFQGLTADLTAELAGIAAQKNYQAGETIFDEGDPGLGFHLVAQGRVKVFKRSPDGKEQILHLFGPGEPFGEVAIFLGLGYPAQALALVETVTVFFPRPALRDLIARNPDLAFGLMAILSQRLVRFTALLESVTLKEVPARLAAFILDLASDGRNQVKLTISKGQLASLLGASPETISRALGRLKNANLIQEDKPLMTITDRSRLQDVADGTDSV